MSDQPATAEGERTVPAGGGRPEVGFAHVAALAFVAARAVPGFGFPIALAGGTGVAHATERLGGRRGLAAGVSAALESVAILGPARMSVPGGQMITAPVIGWLSGRGRGRALQVAACATVRALFNVVTTVLFIAIIAGGVGNYAGTYDATLGRIPGAPEGTAAALIGTAIAIAIWSLGSSWVQVYVFSRATSRWQDGGGIGARVATAEPDDQAPERRGPPPAPDASAPAIENDAPTPARGRFDPRAVIAAASLAFALLLLSTAPVLLAAVATWLALAWGLAPAERAVARPGLALAAVLALGAFFVNTVGGDSVRDGLEHGARGALLVLTATWMRGAAGTEGIREVTRRVLERMRRFHAAAELQQALDALAGDRRMGAAIAALRARLAALEGDFSRMLDATIDWVAEEAGRFRPVAPRPSPALRYKALDAAVLVGAALPALTLAPG